jgi:putative phosphoribosyl transferase
MHGAKPPLPFANRDAAGRYLGGLLTRFAHRGDVLVLGLPRGGVVVAGAVARVLQVPLDICLVRKLGVPGREELAMGAIATGGIVVWNHDVIASLDLPQAAFTESLARARAELERRESAYRMGREPYEVRGRTIVLVDDGLATGASMRAAARAISSREPDWLIIAVPVGSAATCGDLSAEADEIECAVSPEPFAAVGYWYEDFAQTSDEEVQQILQLAWHDAGQAPVSQL